MNKAVVVYQSTPIFGASILSDGTILGMFKQNKLVSTLNQTLKKKNIPWHVILDERLSQKLIRFEQLE